MSGVGKNATSPWWDQLHDLGEPAKRPAINQTPSTNLQNKKRLAKKIKLKLGSGTSWESPRPRPPWIRFPTIIWILATIRVPFWCP